MPHKYSGATIESVGTTSRNREATFEIPKSHITWRSFDVLLCPLTYSSDPKRGR